MHLNTLHDLFIDQLKDIYSAEKQLVQALPKMAKAATSPELQQAFKDHLEMTRGQVQRLESVFEKMGASPGRKKCLGMEGLIKETEEFIGENPAPDVIDAGLISNAQKVEHYEIAAYGTVRAFAETMGHTEAVQLLQQTLDEEGLTDKKLTQLAERDINNRAEQGGSRSGSR
jgi:ferritin-like metal-binding protein YciE